MANAGKNAAIMDSQATQARLDAIEYAKRTLLLLRVTRLLVGVGAQKAVNQPIAIIVQHRYNAVDWSIGRQPSLRVSPLYTGQPVSAFK